MDSVLIIFVIYTLICWLDALKKVEKIIRENVFEQKKKKPGPSCSKDD